jgi:tetratricopeptide (TPR) repeat protein
VGLSTRNLQQYQRAIEDYDRAIQLKPDYADAYNNRGNAYSDLKQHQRAIEDYDRAIQTQSRLCHCLLAIVGLPTSDLQQYQRATEDFDRAIQLKHDYADAYYNRGNTYRNLQQYQRAIEDYDRAIQTQARLCPCLQQSWGCLRKLGEHGTGEGGLLQGVAVGSE